MLQQKVAQGNALFFIFTTFPTVLIWLKPMKNRFKIIRTRVLFKARNLHKTAQYIAFDLNGFSGSYKELLELKG
jgi:A/G-specific adenine glycosylase